MTTTAFSFTLPPLPSANPSTSSQSRAAPVSDVFLFHTADGGDVEFVNGQPTMADGLYTAVYLSMFGGNEEDSGLQGDDRKQYWANLSETDQAKVCRSRTQNMIRSIPAVTGNLRRIEDAAKADLTWLLDDVASAVAVVATMPGLNRVSLTVDITVNNSDYQFSFENNWSVAA